MAVEASLSQTTSGLSGPARGIVTNYQKNVRDAFEAN